MHSVRNGPDGAVWQAGVQRIHSLDLLRGICALMVASYHYTLWSKMRGGGLVDGFLLFCGTYGVSIFFILSGFSLAYAYASSFERQISGMALSKYFRRRIGRLAPLFIGVVLMSVLGRVASGSAPPSWFDIAANVTLLFGFVNPANTPVIGGWSIGIEVVFYLVLPIMLILRAHIWVFLAVGIFLTSWVSYMLADYDNLGTGWQIYVLPANHFIFFAMGVAGSLMIHRIPPLPTRMVLLAMTVITPVIILTANMSSDVEIVTSWRRMILVLASISIVVTLGAWHAPASMESTSKIFGGLSYPLYLIHPLLFFITDKLFDLNEYEVLSLLLLSVGAAVLIDRLIDSPIQKIVRKQKW
jgi:exopolysaccharide production protein ExoZ